MDAAKLEVARRFQPDAAATDFVTLGEGQLCIAYRLSDVVLRFPRSEFARDRLRAEISVLDRIAPVLNHPLPEIVAAELDTPLSHAFAAHAYLPGSPLTAETVARLPDSKLATVAMKTAAFLRDLHSVSMPELPVRTNREFAASLMDESHRYLRPRMTDTRWERVERELDALSGVTTDRLGLCHTDIGGNVLYDDATETVSFIDVGSAMVADPILDFASLSVLGPRFTARCAETYPAIAQRAEDASVVRATFHLQDALYGARQGDWSYVDDVLSTY